MQRTSVADHPSLYATVPHLIRPIKKHPSPSVRHAGIDLDADRRSSGWCPDRRSAPAGTAVRLCRHYPPRALPISRLPERAAEQWLGRRSRQHAC